MLYVWKQQLWMGINGGRLTYRETLYAVTRCMHPNCTCRRTIHSYCIIIKHPWLSSGMTNRPPPITWRRYTQTYCACRGPWCLGNTGCWSMATSAKGEEYIYRRQEAGQNTLCGLSSKQLGHPPGAHELCSKQDRQMVWVTGFTNQCLMTQKISVSWKRSRQCWLDIDAGHHQLTPQLQAHWYIVQCNVTHALAVETKLYLFSLCTACYMDTW